MAAHSDLLMEATMEMHLVKMTDSKMESLMEMSLENLTEMTMETSWGYSKAG